MIDYRKLKDWKFPDIEHAYTADDTMFYALAVGLGADRSTSGSSRSSTTPRRARRSPYRRWR